MNNNDMFNFHENKTVKKKNITYQYPSFDQSQLKHSAMIAVVGSTGAGKT